MTADIMFAPAPFALAHAADTERRAPKVPLDEAHFEAFYRRTAGGVWSYIYRLTGDAALPNADHMRRYVYKTATNLVFDHFRDAKRERGRPIDLPPSELRADRGELRHDMMRVSSELKPQERALLWLAHVEGSSHEEIAESLGVKAKSVKVMLFRARKRLGELLTKKGLAP